MNPWTRRFYDFLTASTLSVYISAEHISVDDHTEYTCARPIEPSVPTAELKCPLFQFQKVLFKSPYFSNLFDLFSLGRGFVNDCDQLYWMTSLDHLSEYMFIGSAFTEDFLQTFVPLRCMLMEALSACEF